MTRTAPSAGRRAPDRLLALMCLVSGSGAFMGAVAPMTPQAPVRLNAALAAVAVGLIALAWFHPTTPLRYGVVLAHVLGVSALVASAATPVGAVGGAVSLVWPAVYSAFHLGRAATRGCVALIVVGLSAALAVNPFVGAVHVGFLVLLTTAAAAEGIVGLVEQLERSARTDPLTGLLNREGLRHDGAAALARCARDGRALTVAVVDLDGFKTVNDRYGHAAGDALLVELAATWRAHLRGGDVVARVGGDEFVLVLPGATEAEVRRLLQRLAAQSTTRWSTGVTAAAPGEALDALISRADQDLYAAKRARPVVPAQRRAATVDTG